MLEEILAAGFAELSLSVDERAIPRYRRYYDALAAQNKVMNLTAIDGEADSARLHFLDSAALLTLADFRGKSVIDVGSGAGFPGLALKVAEPDMRLTLLDSLDKRVRFLRGLADELGFEDVDCLHARAEEAPPELRESFDIACSRAVARLNLLCELCLPFVRTGGLFLAMKGPGAEEETREAARAIRLLGGELERVALYPIPGTETRHSAVMIRKVRETPKSYPRRWAQIKKQPL
ncbi:MAG: 16S rRNA (guanine(527)-N(7))-methyltransferase RsmG [Oscillospiraceae bacterium]|nr:16S rRNA (guanine(527)-N(7))-methyltransferase RsmG [Oscillospiraceae bacterium]